MTIYPLTFRVPWSPNAGLHSIWALSRHPNVDARGSFCSGSFEREHDFGASMHHVRFSHDHQMLVCTAFGLSQGGGDQVGLIWNDSLENGALVRSCVRKYGIKLAHFSCLMITKCWYAQHLGALPRSERRCQRIVLHRKLRAGARFRGQHASRLLVS